MGLNEAHKERLKSHYGIDPTHPAVAGMEAAGLLRSVTREEAAALLGVPHDDPGLESGGILLRYPNDPGTFTIRLDVPYRGRDGREQKYKRPLGQPNRLFVPPGLDLDGTPEVWITEGEFKALAAALRGLPCAALSGVYNWRTDTSGGDPAAAAAKLAGGGETSAIPDSHALIEDLRRDWTGKRFVLWYDSDITQEHPAWPAYGRLAEQLYARGAASVKVLSLPPVPPAKGEREGGAAGCKTGLDDYLRRREAEGHDAVSELRALAEGAPEWVPTGEGAWRYALDALASGDPIRMRRGAAAAFAAGGTVSLQALLKRLGIRGELAKALKEDAAKELEAIRERQECKVEHPAENAGTRTITSAFPPAKEVLPENFPFPPTGRKSCYYDIREGRVVKVSVDEEGGERAHPVIDTVALLVRRLDPVEQDAGIEKWTVAWWEREKWRFADVPARYLFDRKRVGELVDVGLPVSSADIDALIGWLHALRCLAVLGHQGAPELPTVRAVSRCGWHELDGKRFFVLGREILLPDASICADAGDKEEIQPDAGLQTDADIAWAQDISALERQILASFRCGGDPSEHRRFLLDAAAKYPQVAFALGCAAGAPLLRFAKAAGLVDVSGFTVAMVPVNSGRSRHQGKTVWSQVVASLYGWPGSGAEGRLRFADNTRVAMQVLFGTCSDLTVHLEDVHKLIGRLRKGAGEEVDYLLHLAGQGMERGRGARAGGGRRTRSFHAVVFATSEVDFTTLLPAESGSHDRVVKLPPLLPEESDENRREAERLRKLAMSSFGHAGREYLAWLVRKVAEEGEGFILEEIKHSLEELDETLPTDHRRGTAGRLASRAAVALAGLSFLLQALGATEGEEDACMESFLAGWEMALENIPQETVAELALAAVQSYVAQNRESIENLREEDIERPRPPSKWVGSVTEVRDKCGQKVRVVALTEAAFAEAVSREPFCLDSHHALQALAQAGHVVTQVEKRPNGKEVTRFKLGVRVAKVLTRCVCVRAECVLPEEKEGDEIPDKTWVDEEWDKLF
ncbi:DUF927 domain-containing protein [Desulfovirgula thermocuniculi]|uniref:DUF927 domain-containing protein n=1 Tax=Desulfovirgula thermocuniculi TaxID=348842 RepID=UPI000418A79C|nr:DUF927 domain-containing protein [Desulfovirgula thermocuniculi]